MVDEDGGVAVGSVVISQVDSGFGVAGRSTKNSSFDRRWNPVEG